MADNLNISVLCAAKEEYTNQLKHYLTPLIQEGFVSIYDDARENDEENVLRQFQIYLKQIPRWNQTILEQETKRIKDRCPFLMDLVTAIFVSHVKILASVRLGGNHGNIKIKIPTSDIFIHSIYVNAAEKIYYEPQPFRDLCFARKNVEIVKEIIDETVEDTISSMIPIQSILQEYLSSAFSEHTKPDPQPDPPPEAPYERQITGTDIANEVCARTTFGNEVCAPFGNEVCAPFGNEPQALTRTPFASEQSPAGFATSRTEFAPESASTDFGSGFSASTANDVADFGSEGKHSHFSIGDTPVAPIDLGETLDATSTASNGTGSPSVEDNSFGAALCADETGGPFSSDLGQPAIKSIPITFNGNEEPLNQPDNFFYGGDVAILE